MNIHQVNGEVAMSDTEYGAALKLGKKKQYQDAVAKGEYPYLPVLDDVLSYTDIVSTVSLGTMDIPLAKLVGTKTANGPIPLPTTLCLFCRNGLNLGSNG